MTDYVYKNSGDTQRVKIFKHYTSFGVEWDFDLWSDSNTVESYSALAGDLFCTKRDAKNEAEKRIGKLTSIQSETVTEGWKK